MFYHSGNIFVLLEVFNKLGLVGGFDSGKALGSLGGSKLFVGGEVIEFSASVGLAKGLFVLREDSDLSADGDSSILSEQMRI